jgi:hypothetical protein
MFSVSRFLTKIVRWHFRHALASLHFNENIHRDCKKSKGGEKYFGVTYPKFKLGEEVVREVPVPPTYGKIYHLMTNMYVLYKTVCNTDTD